MYPSLTRPLLSSHVPGMNELLGSLGRNEELGHARRDALPVLPGPCEERLAIGVLQAAEEATLGKARQTRCLSHVRLDGMLLRAPVGLSCF